MAEQFLPPDAAERNCAANTARRDSSDEAAIIGSNNWAVDAAHSEGSHALVANDMHLSIGVPNIWYRASMVVPDPADPIESLRLTGVTLPGLPVTVVGSNGHVAWGFTNTGGDWSDLVRIEADPRDPSRYLTPSGPRLFDLGEEIVAIKGDSARTVSVRGTIWGPIVWKDADGREYAQRWVAHDPELLAGDLGRPERTRTVDELMAAIAGLGLPNQNVTMADATGRVAWTIGGAIPRRHGLDGSTPESWADGSRGWDGYVDPADFPRIVDPESGRIWTANAPVVDGTRLATIGDGGYADGIRARIIRDRLMTIGKATPRKMLDIQLDDTALFLERWRTVALDALTQGSAGTPAEPADRQAERGEFRRLVESTWTGHASPESVAYRLVRTFRAQVVRRVLTFVTAPALARDSTFDYTRSLRTEGPVWALVSTRPMHLLDPQFTSWEGLFRVLDRRGDRGTHRGWSHARRTDVGRDQPRADPTPARRGCATAPSLAEHAGGSPPGRCLHAACALAARRTVGAHGRLTRPRGGRYPAHANRAERASAVALLRIDAPRVGGRHTGSVRAGAGGAHADTVPVDFRGDYKTVGRVPFWHGRSRLFRQLARSSTWPGVCARRRHVDLPQPRRRVPLCRNPRLPDVQRPGRCRSGHPVDARLGGQRHRQRGGARR